MAWTWLRNQKTGWTAAGAAGFGIVLGATVAARSVFLLWMPLALLVPAIPAGSGTKDIWRGKTICLLAALLVIGPWWIRNIVVTKDFMPFGTQAGINLPTGFSSKAVELQGSWAPDRGDGEQEISALNLDPVTAEVRLAKLRTSLTVHWMLEHPAGVIRLMLLHVWQEVRSRGDSFSDWLLVFGALGAFVLRKARGVGIVALFVALNLLAIALTWSAEGRFMVPVQPLLVALVGAMTADFARQIMKSLRRDFRVPALPVTDIAGSPADEQSGGSYRGI
jgi:hypothetical protein